MVQQECFFHAHSFAKTHAMRMLQLLSCHARWVLSSGVTLVITPEISRSFSRAPTCPNCTFSKWAVYIQSKRFRRCTQQISATSKFENSELVAKCLNQGREWGVSSAGAQGNCPWLNSVGRSQLLALSVSWRSHGQSPSPTRADSADSIGKNLVDLDPVKHIA